MLSACRCTASSALRSTSKFSIAKYCKLVSNPCTDRDDFVTTNQPLRALLLQVFYSMHSEIELMKPSAVHPFCTVD